MPIFATEKISGQIESGVGEPGNGEDLPAPSFAYGIFRPASEVLVMGAGNSLHTKVKLKPSLFL
jgi:hypothetical protein